MLEASLVPLDHLDACLGNLGGFLQDAADATEGRSTVDDMCSMVRNGSHLWIIYDEAGAKGFVITSINQYPERKILSMNFCGGTGFENWKTLIIDMLKRFAKDAGCDSIEAYGRPGWSKVLKDEGYKSKFVVFELPI